MTKQPFNTLNHRTFKLKYHLFLVTKYRRQCITKPILKRLNEIFKCLINQWEYELLEFNGEPDHIHLLLCLYPKGAPSVFVNKPNLLYTQLWGCSTDCSKAVY